MRPNGVSKKPAIFVPLPSRRVLNRLSKAALMDIAWNLALLGTNETAEEALAKILKEAEIVCRERGDAALKVKS